MHYESFRLSIHFLYHFSCGIGNKRRTIKCECRLLVSILYAWLNRLCSDSVRRNDRHKITCSMSRHATSPVWHTVTLQNRFTSNSGRVKQYFCPCKCHSSCGFRKPLIPAYSDSDCSISRLKCPKSCISGCEVEFFLIIMIIRNMCLSVYSKYAAVCVDNGYGIKKLTVVSRFIKADGDNDTELLRKLFHALYSIIFFKWLCVFIIFISSLLTKILSFEKFGWKYDLRTIFSCFRNQI